MDRKNDRTFESDRTDEPYFIPGYTGFCPLQQWSYGTRYGKSTHDAMLKLPAVGARLSPLPSSPRQNLGKAAGRYYGTIVPLQSESSNTDHHKTNMSCPHSRTCRTCGMHDGQVCGDKWTSGRVVGQKADSFDGRVPERRCPVHHTTDGIRIMPPVFFHPTPISMHDHPVREAGRDAEKARRNANQLCYWHQELN